MRRPGRTGRRLLLLAHVVTSVCWLGAGAANLSLSLAARSATSASQAAASYHAILVIDTWVVIPAAFASLVTGVVVSLTTSWGLARHWWVLVKLVLTTMTIIFSTFAIGVWVDASFAATSAGEVSPVASLLAAGASANLVGLVVMTWLSIAKPRGLTPWSRRAGFRDRSRTT